MITLRRVRGYVICPLDSQPRFLFTDDDSGIRDLEDLRLNIDFTLRFYISHMLTLRHYENLAAQKKHGDQDAGGFLSMSQDAEKQWLLKFG